MRSCHSITSTLVKFAAPTILAIGCASAATVNFNPGGAGVFVFETSSGNELVGGTLFAGTFETVPEVGVSIEDVLTNFMEFDALDNPSAATGLFSSENFERPVAGTDFVSSPIYLIAVDSNSIGTATEMAVFTSNDPAWMFPASDTGPDASGAITLQDTPLTFFQGQTDTIDNPGGLSLTGVNSIQLVAIPEPSTFALLVLGGSLFLRRKR
jgi:hypothetical protein